MSIDVKDLMRDIKENHRKLDRCSKHDFSIDATPDKKFSKMYKVLTLRRSRGLN
jgi:hypothetical protein